MGYSGRLWRKHLRLMVLLCWVALSGCSLTTASSGPTATPTPTATLTPAPTSATKDNFFYAGSEETAAADGAFGNFTQAKPTLSAQDHHTLAELAVESADGKQIIEVGWNVASSLAAGIAGSATPLLFVSYWVDGVWHNCYTLQSQDCQYIQLTTNPLHQVGKPVTVDSAAATTHQYGIRFFNSAWWIWDENEWIGKFSENLWDNINVCPNAGNCFTQIGIEKWFGEVATPQTFPCSQMGNGIEGAQSGSAEITNMAIDVNGQQVSATISPIQPTPQYYTMKEIATASIAYGGSGAQQCNTTSSSATILFSGDDATTTAELWKTDETTKGTVMIQNGGVYHGLAPIDITPYGHVALFDGTTTQGQTELWITNPGNTGATPITTGDVSPLFITPLGNNLVVFQGKDAQGKTQLWVYDGKTASPLSIPDSSTYGLTPTDITLFGNRALFNGTDQQNDHQLWITDGTAAGTHKLSTQTTQLPADGINPRQIVVAGNVAYCIGTGKNALDTIWQSDGTGGGTLEIPIDPATYSPFGLTPADLTPYGNQVLFYGSTVAGPAQLWEASTSEAHAVTSGNTYAPGNITIFGSQIAFVGPDDQPTGRTVVWIMASLAASPKKLTIQPSGASIGFRPGELTAFNNQLLLTGFDAGNNKELWITDGGALTELTTATNTGYSQANAFGITPVGATAVFSLPSAANVDTLWVTDGTPGNTHEVPSIVGASSDGLNPQYFTLIPGA